MQTTIYQLAKELNESTELRNKTFFELKELFNKHEQFVQFLESEDSLDSPDLCDYVAEAMYELDYQIMKGVKKYAEMI